MMIVVVFVCVIDMYMRSTCRNYGAVVVYVYSIPVGIQAEKLVAAVEKIVRRLMAARMIAVGHAHSEEELAHTI